MFNFLKSKINKTGNTQRSFKSYENQEERTTILGIKNFQVIESYKQLRTNVMFAMSAKDVNVVEFSSSFPGEENLLLRQIWLLLWHRQVQKSF